MLTFKIFWKIFIIFGQKNKERELLRPLNFLYQPIPPKIAPAIRAIKAAAT